MKNIMLALLAKLGFNSVDNALSHFDAAARKLQEAVEFNKLRERAHDEVIRRKQEAKTFAVKEQARAQRALDKLQDFLG